MPDPCDHAAKPQDGPGIEELERRPGRAADYEAEYHVILGLMRSLSESPDTVLDAFAESILKTLGCGSAGISVVSEDGATLVWLAVAGAWEPHIRGEAPRDLGRGVDELALDRSMLLKCPQRRYRFLEAVTPPVVEALLVPFRADAKTVGVMWAVIHEQTPQARLFDREDLRLLTSLATFASTAYHETAILRELRAIRDRQVAADVLVRVNQALLISSVRQHKLTADAEQVCKALAADLFLLERRVDEQTRELVDAAERLRLADRMASVGTLAAGLAHDMKNILMPLGVSVDAILLSPELTPAMRADVVAVGAMLDHLRAMARNLTLFAQDPKNDGVEGQTHLSIWRDQVRGFIDTSAGSHVRMQWDIPDDLPGVRLAPHRLTQAVFNLVHNGRDAIAAVHAATEGAPPPGQIVVSARSVPGAGADPGVVVVEVRDNGGGMSAETRRRCLEPFFTTKDRAKIPGVAGGTGLGLSLVHAIVERVGGSLEIDSAPGEGTTVRLKLPAASPEQAEPQAVPPIGRAWVSVKNGRVRALASFASGQLRYEVLEGVPSSLTDHGNTTDTSPGGTLWITDVASAAPEAVRAFLRLGLGRRVVVIPERAGEVGEEWRATGALVCPPAMTIARLRSVVAGDLAALEG